MSVAVAVKLAPFFYKKQNLLYAFCRHRFWIYFRNWVSIRAMHLHIWYFIHRACADRFLCFRFFSWLFSVAVASCAEPRRYQTHRASTIGNRTRSVRTDSQRISIGWIWIRCLSWTELHERVGLESITNHRWSESETWGYDLLEKCIAFIVIGNELMCNEIGIDENNNIHDFFNCFCRVQWPHFNHSRAQARVWHRSIMSQWKIQLLKRAQHRNCKRMK